MFTADRELRTPIGTAPVGVGELVEVGAAPAVLGAGLEDVTGGATAVVTGVAQEPDVTGDGGRGPAARPLQACGHLVMGTARLGSCVEDVRADRAALGHLTDYRGGSPR